MEASEKSNLFQDLTNVSNFNADTINDTEDFIKPTEVESLCVNCGENGTTTLLLAKIPHYREIILSSFICESCGNKDNNIQSGGVVQNMGIIYKVCKRDFH